MNTMKNTKIQKCKESGHDIYSGFQKNVCRTCDNARCRERYKKPKWRKYHRDWEFKRYQSAKEIVNKAKDRPCHDCGVKYPPFVMQFDHRDTLSKRFTIGRKGRFVNRQSLLNEIEKCDVVCANCHCVRTNRMWHKIVSRHKKYGRYNSIYKNQSPILG